MKRILLAVALVCTLAPAQAAADGFGIGPRAGYYRNRGADSGDFLFGAAARMRFLGFLGAEASIDYRQDEYGENIVTAHSWPVQVTGLVYPFNAVYAGVGAGWYRTTYEFDVPGVESETLKDFGWHVGTGLEIPLGTAASLVGDVRWVYLDTELGELPESVGGDTDFYVMSVGVLFGL